MSKTVIETATVKLALSALKELVAQTESGLFAVKHDHAAMQDARQAIAALKSLAEQPAPAAPVQQEPVVWTLTETLNKRETTTHGYLWFSNPQNCSWTPLYTTPPTQRKRLTPTLEADTGYSRAQRAAFEEGWEEAEAAHGIKENT